MESMRKLVCANTQRLPQNKTKSGTRKSYTLNHIVKLKMVRILFWRYRIIKLSWLKASYISTFVLFTKTGEQALITKEPQQVASGSGDWFAWIRVTSRKQKKGKPVVEGWINTAHLRKTRTSSPRRKTRTSSPRPSNATASSAPSSVQNPKNTERASPVDTKVDEQTEIKRRDAAQKVISDLIQQTESILPPPPLQIHPLPCTHPHTDTCRTHTPMLVGRTNLRCLHQGLGPNQPSRAMSLLSPPNESHNCRRCNPGGEPSQPEQPSWRGFSRKTWSRHVSKVHGRGAGGNLSECVVRRLWCA